MSIEIRNPHSVLAVLENRPRDIERIALPAGALSPGWTRVAQIAEKRGIRLVPAASPGQDRPASKGPKGRDGRKDAKRDRSVGGRMGGASATVKEHPGVSVEELFEGASKGGLWLALDSIQDPQNVGAIFRVAGFFGVRGILLTEERSASLTGTVYDVASGGVECVPFSQQINLKRALEAAKEAGLWILGSSEHATMELSEVPRDRPWLLILGNEEKGMRRLTEESCDMVCKIPQKGKVDSLNVSVAAGILISHLA